jgi:short-subunit dehydrogenase
MLQGYANNHSKLAAVAQEIYEIDLENEESIKAAATAYGDQKLDILVNCAGLHPRSDPRRVCQLILGSF